MMLSPKSNTIVLQKKVEMNISDAQTISERFKILLEEK